MKTDRPALPAATRALFAQWGAQGGKARSAAKAAAARLNASKPRPRAPKPTPAP